MSFRIRMALLVVALVVIAPIAAYAGGGGGTNQERDTVGLFRAGTALWILRSSNSPTCASPTLRIFVFGDPTDTPLSVDPDGDGLAQVAVYRAFTGFSSFFIRANNDAGAASATRIDFGAPGDIPVAGDFDGMGGEEVGVYRPSTNTYFLNLSGGTVELPFGTSGDVPVIGNWDGSADGSEEVGIFRPSEGLFYLRDSNTPGAATVTIRALGDSTDMAFGGDFDGDDTATVGVFRSTVLDGQFYFNNMTTGPGATDELAFGIGTEIPVLGDWDGPMTDEDGC